jgi:outer membrane protein OmpA-like peptidoglycan-associated protein
MNLIQRIKKYLLLVFFLTFQSFLVFAQSGLNELATKADNFFRKKDFAKALNLYKQLSSKDKENITWKYKQGLCHFYLNSYEQSLYFFKICLEDKRHKDELLIYTAKSLHQTEKFDEAIGLYKTYLKVSSNFNKEREEVKKLILHCIQAKRSKNKIGNALIVNLGDSLNTKFDELLPIQNLRFSDQLFYSSNRKGNFDVYSSTQNLANWSISTALSRRINTVSDEILNAFPDKGFQVLYQRDGQSIVDNYLDGNNQSLAVPFESFKQKGSWNGDYFFYSDKLLAFVSDRPGGFGGLDIYFSYKITDSTWSEPYNAGIGVNSKFNERSPFLSKDGKTIYFSSDRKESIGSFDVFKSVFSNLNNKWSKAERLEKPVNSYGDDLFYRPADNGLSAYLSSIRNLGQGGFDLFIVYLRNPLEEQLNPRTEEQVTEFVNIAKYSKSEVKAIVISEEKNPENKNNKFYFQSILYDNINGVFGQGIERQLDNIVQLMSRYPLVRLLISAHSDNSQKPTTSSFLTLKHAERLSSILINKGVKSDRIVIRGCGSAFPIAKNERFDGSVDVNTRKLNNRVDFDFYYIDNLDIEITNNKIGVNPVMMDSSSLKFKEDVKGLSYKIQLIKTPLMFEDSVLNQEISMFTEKQSNGSEHAYMLGYAKDFDNILLEFKRLKNLGYAQIKIIPYINGYPISREEAAYKKYEYNDLNKFLSFEK